MSFKFFVGQAVEYTPVGEKTAGLYKIVRQMPEEEQAFDLKSTFQLSSEPASAHSTRDKLSNSKSRAIAERNPRSTSR